MRGHLGDKPLQPGTTAPTAADPERMTLEDDGQPAFDAMWADPDAGPTPDGYLERPVWP